MRRPLTPQCAVIPIQLPVWVELFLYLGHTMEEEEACVFQLIQMTLLASMAAQVQMGCLVLYLYRSCDSIHFKS